MKVIGVIPARYGSTRFPGKPLVPLLGKPLLQWVIEAALHSSKIDKVLVATDDERIANIARLCDVVAVMTDPELPSGSDRVCRAVKNEKYDVVLNIQGDEPLIVGSTLDNLVDAFLDKTVDMATLGGPMTLDALTNANTAKVVVNQNGDAIYFSRCPIPYSREKPKITRYANLKHVGIYAYKKAFLERFCSTPPVEIEIAEGLEQLRALYLGGKIRVVLTGQESWGVDTPEDVLKVEAKLRLREKS